MRRFIVTRAACLVPATGAAQPVPPIDIPQLLADAGVSRLALAVIESGKVARLETHNLRDIAKDEPMTRETVMPALSWTKFRFFAYVAELAADGRIALDASGRHLFAAAPSRLCGLC